MAPGIDLILRYMD